MSLVTDLITGILSVLWQLSSLPFVASLLFFFFFFSFLLQRAVFQLKRAVHEVWGSTDFLVKSIDLIKRIVPLPTNLA